MSETQHSAQVVEQFQSSFEQYKQNSDIVTEAIQNREDYKTAVQKGEALNDKERQLLMDAALAENTMRDKLHELVKKYMDEGKYQDAIAIINQAREVEEVTGGASSASVFQTTEYKEKVSPIRVDTRKKKVFRGAEEFNISPTLYRILLCLSESSGKLISKQELFNTVWPGEQYDGARIDQCLSRIRKVIGGENLESRHGHGVILHQSQVIS